MRKKFRAKAGLITGLLIVCTIIITGMVFAGDLEPGTPPTIGTMHTLEDIYNVVAYIGVAPVAKTGQTESFATGDDGDLEAGVGIPSPRFTDNGDGTVTDNLTSLIWLKNADVSGTIRNFPNTRSNIAELNATGTMEGNASGDTSNNGSHQTDWRLPNRFELESLLNMAYDSPAVSNAAGTGIWIESDPFTGLVSGYYWSSTTRANDSTYGWFVHFGAGGVRNFTKNTGGRIWAVRGGNF